MKPTKQWLCVSPKDASIITGKTVRSCYSLLARIRRSLQKKPHQVITIKEFCEYIGILLEDALRLLE